MLNSNAEDVKGDRRLPTTKTNDIAENKVLNKKIPCDGMKNGPP